MTVFVTQGPVFSLCWFSNGLNFETILQMRCCRLIHIYRIWNEFSFHTVFMKRVVCFYIPEPLARGLKTHNEFHNYRIKWKFISDSFYHMSNLQKRKKNTVLWVLLPILLRKTRQRRGVTYDVIDELRRLSLSKCFPVLCHKLIYEIAIFHSINRETCDKKIRYITDMSVDKWTKIAPIFKIRQLPNIVKSMSISLYFVRTCYSESWIWSHFQNNTIVCSFSRKLRK